MNKVKFRLLSLRRQSLRPLRDESLREAAAGILTDTDDDGCWRSGSCENLSYAHRAC